MKKTIFDALKAKFSGVSDNILDRIATKIAKTVTTEEQVKEAVENYTLQQVIDGYADSRASEAQQTAVKNYESKYHLKDGAKLEDPQPPTPQPSESNDIPEWAIAMQEAFKKQSEELAAFKKGNLTTSRKKQLTDITSKLPESMRKAYDRITVDTYSDEDFANLLSEVTTETDTILTEARQKGASFGGPNARNNQGGEGVTPKATNKEIEALAAKMNIL